MAGLFSFRPTVPKLEEILKGPDKHSLGITQKSVRKRAADFYETKEKDISKLGMTSNTKACVDDAAALIAVAIKNHELKTVAQVKAVFPEVFDSLLIRFARTSRGGENRVIAFFQKHFHFLQFADAKAKTTCPDRAARKEAYRMAIAQLARRIRHPDFDLTQAIGGLFRTIFRNECTNIQRWRSGEQTSFEMAFSKFADLPEEAARLLQPPITMLGEDFTKIRDLHPECYDLYYNFYIEGYKYSDLERIFQKSAKTLRNKASLCRRLLQEAYLKLTK